MSHLTARPEKSSSGVIVHMRATCVILRGYSVSGERECDIRQGGQKRGGNPSEKVKRVCEW